MIEQRIVRRYAAALFGAASEADVVDRVESDLGLVGYALENSADLKNAVESPVIPAEQKKAVLHALFADKVHEITMAYLGLLIDKRREEAIQQTESEFIRLANAARGIIEAHITTAVHLDTDAESRLLNKLSKLTGKSVQLVKMVDPAIIGGMTIQIGDTIIDGSVRGQLDVLKENLLS